MSTYKTCIVLQQIVQVTSKNPDTTQSHAKIKLQQRSTCRRQQRSPLILFGSADLPKMATATLHTVTHSSRRCPNSKVMSLKLLSDPTASGDIIHLARQTKLISYIQIARSIDWKRDFNSTALTVALCCSQYPPSLDYSISVCTTIQRMESSELERPIQNLRSFIVISLFCRHLGKLKINPISKLHKNSQKNHVIK